MFHFSLLPTIHSTVATETLVQPWFFLRQRNMHFENLKTTHRVNLKELKAGWPCYCLLDIVSNLLWHLHAAGGPYHSVVCLWTFQNAEKLKIDSYPKRHLFQTSPKPGSLVYIDWGPTPKLHAAILILMHSLERVKHGIQLISCQILIWTEIPANYTWKLVVHKS